MRSSADEKRACLLLHPIFGCPDPHPSATPSNRRLLTEARTLLERVIQLDASSTREDAEG